MGHHQQENTLLCLPQALGSGEGGQRVQAHTQAQDAPKSATPPTRTVSTHTCWQLTPNLLPPALTPPQDLGAAREALAPHHTLLTAGRAVMAQQYRNQKAADSSLLKHPTETAPHSQSLHGRAQRAAGARDRCSHACIDGLKAGHPLLASRLQPTKKPLSRVRNISIPLWLSQLESNSIFQKSYHQARRLTSQQ